MPFSRNFFSKYQMPERLYLVCTNLNADNLFQMNHGSGRTGQWNEVEDEFLEFYNLWRSSDSRPKFLRTFPYQLSLGTDNSDQSLLPFDPEVTQILITQAYDNMLHRLLALRRKDLGQMKGVVTGQSGFGAPFHGATVPRLTAVHKENLLS